MKINPIWVAIILFDIININTPFAKDRLSRKFVDKNIAGIIVGKDHEQKVIQKFGRGTLVQDGYAICYYNTYENQSIIFEIGPDKLIEGIILSAEKRLDCMKINKKDKTSFMTRKGIRLGDPPNKIIEIYGEPEKKEIVEGILIFQYHTDSKKDPQVRLFYDAYLHFKDDRLIKLSIHDGE
jgi:hypothetical protein